MLQSISFYFVVGPLLLMFFCSSQVFAQDMFRDLMAPPGKAKTTIGYKASTEPGMSSESVSNPRQDQSFSFATPVYQDQKNQYMVGWNWSDLHLDTDQKLADGSNIPNDFYNSQLSVGWKHNEDKERFWRTSVSYGSASDHLFDSHRTSTLSVTGLYSASKDPTSRWVWFLNYSNNRVFLNNIPFPGFAYIYMPSPDFIGLFGIPFVFIKKNWDWRWSTDAVIGPFLGHADLSYSLIERSLIEISQIYLAFDSIPQTFYRAARTDEDSQLFVTQSKLVLGYKQTIASRLFVNLYGGLAFDRSVDERKGFKYSSSSIERFENRWILGAELKLTLPGS